VEHIIHDLQDIFVSVWDTIYVEENLWFQKKNPGSARCKKLCGLLCFIIYKNFMLWTWSKRLWKAFRPPFWGI